MKGSGTTDQGNLGCEFNSSPGSNGTTGSQIQLEAKAKELQRRMPEYNASYSRRRVCGRKSDEVVCGRTLRSVFSCWDSGGNREAVGEPGLHGPGPRFHVQYFLIGSDSAILKNTNNLVYEGIMGVMRGVSGEKPYLSRIDNIGDVSLRWWHQAVLVSG